jgi:sialic acid synthase SpsE
MVYIIAEIGINHNGSLERALRMIQEAKKAGADAVKFQKRTPELCVPKSEWVKPKYDTFWGDITYLEYKKYMEFGKAEYARIDAVARKLSIDWFVSVWDLPSLEFALQFDTPFIKIPSAKITDKALMREAQRVRRKKIISTGMSTMPQIYDAAGMIGHNDLIIMHCTSSYPCSYDELNLKMIPTLRRQFPGLPIGYSGHETGLATTIAAVALGATYIERHFTLDRTDWGTDQAASVEPQGLTKLVRDIRLVERALGDGVKKVYKSELPSMEKLRGNVHHVTKASAV